METIEFLDPKTGIVGEKPAANGDNDPRPTSDPEDGESSEQDDQPLPAKIARSPTGVKSEPHVKASKDDDNVNDQASTSSAAGDDEEPTSSSHNQKAQAHRTMEPLEVETITTEEITEEELYDDMESLLHSEEDGATTKSKSKKTASGGALRMKSKQTYCCGKIQPHPVGNMTILLPDQFERTGWGVVGPHWFGPACVWLILAVATRFTIKGALTIGPISTLICIGFMGYCSYLLANVSFRDPGICLSQEIPNDVPEDQRRQWRWCDFCSAYQPPDGAHCPDCNICVGK